MELWWHSTGFPLMVSLAQQIRWFLQESRQTAQGHSQRRAGRHTWLCAGRWGLLSQVCQQQNGKASAKCVCSRNGTEVFTPLTHNPYIWADVSSSLIAKGCRLKRLLLLNFKNITHISLWFVTPFAPTVIFLYAWKREMKENSLHCLQQ